MSLVTLLDFLPRLQQLDSREAVRFDNGIRTWVFSYRDLYRQIAGFSQGLADRGLSKGDRLLLWCENRPEWLIAFWGSLARGLQVVPVDYRSSPHLAARIQQEVQARLLVYGRVPHDQLSLPALPAVALSREQADRLETVEVAPEDVVQIVYTSGTTGHPRGVVHRHGNLCANLEPIAREIDRYRLYARPFQPIRIMSLLPVSHVFGQAVALFVPPLLGGSAVFLEEIDPQSVVRVIRSSRVSVLCAVPQMLGALRQEMVRRHGLGEVPQLGRGWMGAARRWWKYRRVHRSLGWKFWCFVVGGAPVPSELEKFWKRLGFAVIQGYGLTESSPVVAVNHPFDSRVGSIGKAMPGQEVKLAPDGEILVRGPSIAGEFLGAEAASGTRVEDGWLHTGDLGDVDADGRIYFRGRKKEMIVTAAGLNVFPEDVEAALKQQEGVRDSAVVGQVTPSGEVVHAALILDGPQVEPGEVVRQANRLLEPHQRIQGWTAWPEMDFPRTSSTFKVKRAEVAARIAAGKLGREGEALDAVDFALRELLSGSGSRDRSLEEDLGLTSLDRIELLGRLEDRFAVRLEEQRFAESRTLGQLRAELDRVRGRDQIETQASREEARFPFWADSLPVRWLRWILLDLILLPAQRRLVQVRAEGLGHLETAHPPVVFAANHCSHLDTTVFMAALPPVWRHRVAPAMRKGYFTAHFHPEGQPWRVRLRSSLKYLLACGLFHAYPLPQQLGTIRSTLQFTGYLVERGNCPLIFPEGVRSGDGSLQPFRQGVGLMAIQLRIPVVPVFIEGTFQVWSKHERRPTRRGDVRVVLGAPLDLSACNDPESATRQVERAVQDLAATP